MHSQWLGEFMGTLVLILLGNGVNAGVTLRKSYAADSGWMVIATGWALAVLCGVVVAQAFGSPGANINPAVTFAAAVSSGDFSMLPLYWSAQLLGAMCGAALMALHYGPHWRETPDPAAKLGIFCTNAAIHSPLFNLISEIIGTAVLVLVAACYLFKRRLGNRTRRRHGPMAGRQPGVGHRTLARRHNRLRHQSRTRPWPAHRARHPAHPRQRAAPTGATRPSRSSATSSAEASPASCSTSPAHNARVGRAGLQPCRKSQQN